MKKSNFKLILIAVTLFSSIRAYAYPPDNAAVLYYKAVSLYQVDDKMKDMLAKGTIDVNDQIKEFVVKNRQLINTVLDAAEIKNCDWGLDISQGIKMVMPPLGQMKSIARLIIADAKISLADGDYQTAISRCMSLYRMARHINDRYYICYLIGIRINDETNECLKLIIAQMPHDVQDITQLKDQISDIDSIPFSIKPAIMGERDIGLIYMTKEQLPEIVSCEDEVIATKILSLDQNAIDRNRQYHKEYYLRLTDAFDTPYVQGRTVMEQLHEKMKADIKIDPNLILIETLAPATDKIFTLLTRFKTNNNAIKTAIEIYMIKAKTGKLPDTLPADLPKDLFSGKDFQYIKTDDGFILRCQGKDLDKGKIYQYEFKVNK